MKATGTLFLGLILGFAVFLGGQDYSLAFLNRYLKGDRSADPGQRRSGVAEVRVK